MVSFPVYSSGRLRIFFVLFSIIYILKVVDSRKIASNLVKILMIILIAINALNCFVLDTRMKREIIKTAKMIFFSPYYRNLMIRGEAEELIFYLKENDVNKDDISSYNTLMKSINTAETIEHLKNFTDQWGNEFISYRINDNSELNMMKYEFSEGQLKRFPTNFSLSGKANQPIRKVNRSDAMNFIKTLNAQSTEYRYRLPTLQEYAWAAGDIDSVFNGYSTPFLADKIKPIHKTSVNNLGFHALLDNVDEWSQDDLDKEFGILFGGNAHLGSHAIAFADQSTRLDGHLTYYHGFRLIAEQK